jgi:FlaA1/EpsC-like NDP-sugar epimerase
MKEFFGGKTILVTGATGSIGSQILRKLVSLEPKSIIAFSRDDSKQFYLQQELREQTNIEYVIGDVRDLRAVERVFDSHIDVVFHAAALKHVEIGEQNPAEAVKTNVLGTQNVVDLALRSDVDAFVTISTDKAVNPNCTMGATKYIAERITLAANLRSRGGAFSSVRFGNVLGTRGSVLPTFLRQINRRKPLVITEREVTRFVITIDQAVDLILEATRFARGGEVFVLKMPAMNLGDLVDVIVDKIGPRLGLSPTGVEVEAIGLKAGEKLHEDLVSKEETRRMWESDKLYVVYSDMVEPKPPEGFEMSQAREYSSQSTERLSLGELESLLLEVMETMED